MQKKAEEEERGGGKKRWDMKKARDEMMELLLNTPVSLLIVQGSKQPTLEAEMVRLDWKARPNEVLPRRNTF